MVELDYKISATSPEQRSKIDLSNADEGTLHYNLFLGDICLRIGQADFSTGWGWVPVLDFAVGLVRVLESLEAGAVDNFEFTESEAAIYFDRADDNVTVTANYTKDTATIGYAELLASARGLLRQVMAELLSAYPSLETNPFYVRMRRETLQADE